MRRRSLGVSLLLSLVAGMGTALPAGAAPGLPEHVPGEVLVRFEPGVSSAERAALRARVAAREATPLDGLPKVELLRLPPGRSVADAVAALEARPEVRYAQPNFVYRLEQTIPNDTHFQYLWGLHNIGQSGGVADADIDAPEAWSAATGSSDVMVAVIDTGVDPTHLDLQGNLAPGGKDWVANDMDPADEHGHGTHVAGTIGARGDNGRGVTGVSWRVSILPLRVLNAQGRGFSAHIASAIAYAAEQGADVINLSLGGASRDPATAEAIRGASRSLVVAAAGNDGTDNDVSAVYPCNEGQKGAANVVCVAATNRHDERASFSNFGATAVHLGAPGQGILSTTRGGGYGSMSGTSMATPHVAGAAALLWSAAPGASVSEVKGRLLGNVDPIPSLAGVTVTGGRLNVAAALAASGEEVAPAAPIAEIEPAGGIQRAPTFTVRWGSPDVERYDVRFREAGVITSFATPDDWLDGTTETSASFDGSPASTYCFSARDDASEGAAWGEERCTAVPMNDRALKPRGTWSRRTAAGTYLGTVSVARERGSALSADVRAQRLAVVATRCPSC
ncbi:MAG TPA: S8 family peptidase, partial [Actinomycetota bacterium]|nr:S8 family peptidase [Actinomycetota bacterium]